MSTGEARRVLKILLGKKSESSLLEDILPHAAAAGGTFAAGEYLARTGSKKIDENVLPTIEDKTADATYSGVRVDTPEAPANYLSWQQSEAWEKRMYDADAVASRTALRAVLARKGVR